MKSSKNVNDRTAKLIKAFNDDKFTIEAIHIEFNDRIGIRARHNTATNYETKQPKKVFYLEGDHYQMGYLLGLLAEPDIERMATEFVDNIFFWFIDGDKTPRHSIISKFLGEIIEFIIDQISKNKYPDIPPKFNDEMHGMVEGCRKANPLTKVNYRRLLTLNIGIDILCSLIYTGNFSSFVKIPMMDLKPSEFKLPVMCNGFAIFGEAADGNHYLGRDFMFPTGSVFQDTACMIIHNPLGFANQVALPAVSVTAPGMIGSVTAMNLIGIGVGVNMVPSGNCTPDQIGINSLLMVRYIAQNAVSAKDAVDIMTNLPRGVSWNYIIADGANDQACVVEAGSSAANPDFFAYPPDELMKKGLLPDHNFLRTHQSAKLKNGLMVRWSDYRYPEKYLAFNQKLWEFHNQKNSPPKVLHPDAFTSRGYINKTLRENNCPAAFFFAPERMNRDDIILFGNHFIIPEMRLFAMQPWTALIAAKKQDDIQWRYDKLNDEIQEALKSGPIDYDTAKILIDFLAPNNTKYHSNYYEHIARSKDGREIRIEGCVSLCDLKRKTIESHYGYFGDQWIMLTLPNYIQ